MKSRTLSPLAGRLLFWTFASYEITTNIDFISRPSPRSVLTAHATLQSPIHRTSRRALCARNIFQNLCGPSRGPPFWSFVRVVCLFVVCFYHWHRLPCALRAARHSLESFFILADAAAGAVHLNNRRAQPIPPAWMFLASSMDYEHGFSSRHGLLFPPLRPRPQTDR